MPGSPSPLRRFGLGAAPVLDAADRPREAALALLGLADRPIVRMGGDAVRFRLTAAALLLRAGDATDAGEVATAARQICTRLGSPLTGACDVVLARVARVSGEVGKAWRLAHQGLERLVADGVRPEVLDALEVLGGLAVDAGRPADGVRLLVVARCGHADTGQCCLHEATTAAALLGADGSATVAAAERLDVASAVALARRGRGTRRRPPTGWDSLTPSERQVALLVAEGFSNPDIAERLFVSRATVKTHLAHAFTKLDVTSRAQLAAMAARRSAGP